MLYREVCRLQPSSAEAWSNLGVALHLEGHSSEAVSAFRHSIQLRSMPRTVAMLTVDLCRLRQADEVERLLHQEKQHLGDIEIADLLAPCYLEYGEPLDGVLAYRALVERGVEPRDANAVNLVKAHFRASHRFLLALEKAPGNAEYLAAVKAAREGRSLSPRSAFPLAAKEAPFLRPGMTVQQFSVLLPEHANEAALLYVLGVLNGEWAMQAYLECEKQFIGSPWVRKLRVDMLSSQGHTAEGVTELKALIDERVPLPDLPYELAMIYRDGGALEDALEYFRKQGVASPQDERVPVGISDCLLRLGRYRELRAHLAPLARQSEPPEWALLDLASAEDNLENTEGALRVLLRAAKQYPKNATVHFRLAAAYRRLNRLELAQKEITLFRELKYGPAER
jgi:tetratricopeptide (TPR) repeat protein